MEEIDEIKSLLESNRVETTSDMYGVGYSDSESAKIASLLNVNAEEGSYSACHIENGSVKGVYIGGKAIMTFKPTDPDGEMRILEDKIKHGLI